MAHDDPDQAHNPEEGHETEGRAHDPQGRDRADHAVGNGTEDNPGLHGAPELHGERQINHPDRDAQDHRQLGEAGLPLLQFTRDLKPDGRASPRPEYDWST